MDYLLQNWDEILGTLLGLIYIGCSVMGRKELWIFGLLNSLLYILVFYRAKFYADLTLQIYYVGVSIYGLYYWIKTERISKKRISSEAQQISGEADGFLAEGDSKPPIKTSTIKDWLLIIASTLAIWAAYYFLWLRYTDDAFPAADACTTALCITATWMLARRMLDNWLLFILADAFTCYLYCLKGIYFAATLMAIYTILAIVGYFKWKRSLS